MAKLEKHETQTNIRGLGCGGHIDKPMGKVRKICVDCGTRTEAIMEKVICDECGGPLSSSYDE